MSTVVHGGGRELPRPLRTREQGNEMRARTVRYGDKEISFHMTCYLPNGTVADQGQAWADAHDIERARGYAYGMLNHGSHLGSYIEYVDVYGRELEFLGDAWHPTKDYSKSSSERIYNPNPPKLNTADASVSCYETTVMDYFEKVHPRRSDGSCKCGKHASRWAERQEKAAK